MDRNQVDVFDLGLAAEEIDELFKYFDGKTTANYS